MDESDSSLANFPRQFMLFAVIILARSIPHKNGCGTEKKRKEKKNWPSTTTQARSLSTRSDVQLGVKLHRVYPFSRRRRLFTRF